MDTKHPWEVLAERLGAEVHRGLRGKVPVVQVRVGHTIVTADAMHGETLMPATRVRAFYVDDGSFRFSLRSAAVSTELGKIFFGMQDIRVGDRSFDRRFVLQGEDEARTRALFGRPRVLELLAGFWNLTLTAGPADKFWRDSYVRGDVDGLNEISFRSETRLSAERLERIFGLFREILHGLGLADDREDDVGQLVSSLRARGGTIHELHVLLWDGDAPRREAAELLGERQDPEAVEALMEVLSDPDAKLRLAAVEALGRIGDARAVAPLAGLLADRTRVAATVVDLRAEWALERLGAGDLVAAFHRALRGEDEALRRCVYTYRASGPVARALVAVMEGSDLHAAEAAGRTLGRMGVMEVVPELRRIQRTTGWDRTREASRQAIADLESMASLPRPVEPEPGGRDTLPRAAGAPDPDTTTLPRAAPRDGDEAPRS